MTGATLRPANPSTLAEAGRVLRAGGLVAFPTETVYGLGADASNDAAVARVFAAKARPKFNPLIVHVLRLDDTGDDTGEIAAARFAGIDDRARLLAEKFWPGPLTLVLPRRRDAPLSLLVSAGLDSVALRAPAGAVARDLIAAAGCPIAAPSANRSGAVSPTIAAHVIDELGDAVDLILDGGPCAVGIESTVVDLTGADPVLLRPGGLAAEDIEAVIGSLGAPDSGAKPRSPGMVARHYAPARPLRLNAQDVAADEALLAFGPEPPKGAAETLNLSAAGDVTEAAANLFAMLRALDRPAFRAIAVSPVPEDGLGRAINDRLRRAAAIGGD